MVRMARRKLPEWQGVPDATTVKRRQALTVLTQRSPPGSGGCGREKRLTRTDVHHVEQEGQLTADAVFPIASVIEHQETKVLCGEEKPIPNHGMYM